MRARSSVIGMTSGYQPSTPSWAAATANEPAPRTCPGRSTWLMFTRTSGRPVGLRGGGRTAARASGSVSQRATTPVDQISGSLELAVRVATISASVRAP